MKTRQSHTQGFTLIELLTVIAIIAVLAAILFPVFNAVRSKVRETSCMSNLHEIGVKLKLYRTDNEKYPAVLLGFVEAANGGFYGGSGQGATIDQLSYRPLTATQKYLKDKDVFLCPVSGNKDPNQYTTAVYPFITSSPLSNTSVVFTPVMHHNMGDSKNVPEDQPVYYYKYDSYDTGPRVDRDGKPLLDSSGQPIIELHYSLDWTGNPDPTADAPNQLKYKDPPPDSTVVTWCTYHAAVSGSDHALVLFLNGSAKTISIQQMVDKGPLGLKP